MSTVDWYALAGGVLLVGWAGFELIRLWRTGEIRALHYLPLSASRGDPRLWFAFIIAVDVAFLCLGIAMILR